MDCERCGDHVDRNSDDTVVIEYMNFFPERKECYAFCADHSPSDSEELDALKRRIRDGELLDVEERN